MWQDDPNWQMTALFLLALALLCFVMKLTAMLLPVTSQIKQPFISWLLASPDVVLPPRSVTSFQPVLLRALILLGALCLGHWLYGRLVSAFLIRGIFLGYLAVPILLLMSE